MIIVDNQRNWYLILANHLSVLVAALLAYGYKLTSSNIYNQIPAVFSLLNPELYQQDFYIQEMTQFTPRYYYYYLLHFPVQLGISFPIVCLGYYILAFASFLFGLYYFASLFHPSKLVCTIFVFLGFAATVNGRIGHADLFRIDPIPATLAMGLVIWGFYFCFRQKWILGYLFFGLTSLLQFLVGVLPGILMAIPLLLAAKKKNKISLVIFSFLVLFICASFIYLPMLLNGNTSSNLIDDLEFVNLYAYIRHPHHLIFSSFGFTGSRGWLNFILFTFGGLLCIKSCKSLSPLNKLNLTIVILISSCLLLVNYIFVELYPVALVAKLQFARTTPFAQLMILLALSILFVEEYQRGNTPLAFLLIISPILRGAGILLFILGIALWLRQLKSLDEERKKRNEADKVPFQDQNTLRQERRNFSETQNINASFILERRVFLSQQDKSWNYSNLVIIISGIIAAIFTAIAYNLYTALLIFLGLLITVYTYQIFTNNKVLIFNYPVLQVILVLSLLLAMAIKFFPDGIIVDIFLILWLFQIKKQRQIKSTKVIATSIFLFILFMILYNHYALLLLGAIALPLWLEKSYNYTLQTKTIIASSLAILLVGFFTLGLFQALPHNLLTFFQQRIRITANANDDVAKLALRFQSLSKQNALVLVPPLDEEFRFYSHRAVVFTFKSFPFTDRGILDWKERLEAISGTLNISNLSLDSVYGKIKSKQLMEIAHKFGANYILTRSDWHPKLDGVVVDDEEDWRIWKIN